MHTTFALLLQWMQSDNVYWHSEWDGDFAHGFDVGLLHLDQKAPLTKPQINKMSNALQDRVLSSAGWRTTDTYKTNGELLVAENLTVLPLSTCEKEFDRDLKDHMICVHPAHAENPLGEQISSFDVSYCQAFMPLWFVEYPGQPLLILNKPDNQLSQGDPRRDVVVGIASFALDNFDLAPRVVYTRVSAFWDWVEATIERETSVGHHNTFFAKHYNKHTPCTFFFPFTYSESNVMHSLLSSVHVLCQT